MSRASYFSIQYFQIVAQKLISIFVILYLSSHVCLCKFSDQIFIKSLKR